MERGTSLPVVVEDSELLGTVVWPEPEERQLLDLRRVPPYCRDEVRMVDAFREAERPPSLVASSENQVEDPEIRAAFHTATPSLQACRAEVEA